MEFASFVGLFIEYGYFLVFVAVFLDNAGLPLPGELALLAFGFLARTGHVSVGWGAVAAVVGAMAGDTMSYWLGRLAGMRVLHVYCRLTLGSGQCVDKARAFYGRFGRVAIVVGRFALGVRAFLMPLAGSARLPYGQFLVFDAIGAVLWSGVFLAVGYALGNQVEAFSGRFRQGEMVLGSALGIAVVVYLGGKLWRRRRFGVGLLDAEGR